MRSSASDALSAAALSSASRSSTSASSSRRMRLPPLPTSGRSSAGSAGDRAQELGERALAPERRARAPARGRRRRRRAGSSRGRRVEGREAWGALLEDLQLCVVHGHPSSGAGERRGGSSDGAGRPARELVEGDRAGDAGVERLDAAGHGRRQRDRDELRDAGERLGGEPRSLGADDEHGRRLPHGPRRSASRRARRGRTRSAPGRCSSSSRSGSSGQSGTPKTAPMLARTVLGPYRSAEPGAAARAAAPKATAARSSVPMLPGSAMPSA